MSPKIRLLTSLSLAEVETICLLADSVRLHASPSSTLTPSPILPSSENSRSLDHLMTRYWSQDKIRLLRHVQGLPQASLAELAALYWFGRGDATLPQLLAYARESIGITLPYYLVDSPYLAVYLRTALGKL